MILPATYSAALLLMFACLFCWGSWANTFKFAGRWRFEHYAYDVALGVALCAVIAAFTLGSLNTQDLTFQDNFLIASTRKMAYAFGVGILFSIANLLLMGSFSTAGLSGSFPIAFGVTVITSAVWNYFPSSSANPLLLFGGLICLAAAVVLNAFAQVSHADAQVPVKPLRPDPRAPGSSPPPPVAIGVILAVISGLVMGVSLPLVDFARSGENGVSPYGIALLLSGGIFFSSFLFIPFFLNFPIQGAPVEFRAYFKGSKKQHFWGLFGGMVWMAGTIAYLVGLGTATLTPANIAVNFGVVWAAALLAALFGLLLWREFRNSLYRVKMFLLGMFVLYAAGTAMVAIAPIYTK